MFSGAGASADAGIPTFRGEGKALWMYAGGVLLPFFGTPFGWRWAPWLVWPAYRRWFAPALLAALPTAFHRLLAALPELGVPVRVVTQNVDGLEEVAGLLPSYVAQVHGTARRVVCSACDATLWDCSTDIADVGSCPTCGGWPRPAATLFTEPLPTDAMERADRFTARATRESVLLIVGLGGAVPTSDPFIRAVGRVVPSHRRVQVNVAATPYDAACGLNVRAPAGPFFEAVLRWLRGGPE